MAATSTTNAPEFTVIDSEELAYERPMPEHDECVVRSILKLGETDEIPSEVKSLYWDISRTARRIGCPVSSHELILLAIVLNRPVQAEPETFFSVVNSNNIKRDGRVVAKFRNQWKFGRYHGHKSGKILVELDDDTAEVREIGPTYVRLPNRAELQALGE